MLLRAATIAVLLAMAACSPQNRSPENAAVMIDEGIDLFTRGCVDNIENLAAAEPVFQSSRWPARGKGRYGSIADGFQAQVTRTNDGRGYRCSVIVTGVDPAELAARIRPIVAQKFGDRAKPNGDTSHGGQPSSWNIQGFAKQRLIGVGSTRPALVAGQLL